MSGPINVTVNTSSVTVANNPSRKRVWIVNSGNYPVYLMSAAPAGGSPQTAAVLGQGIRLNPHGGTFTTYESATFFGICANAGGQVSGYDE